MVAQNESTDENESYYEYADQEESLERFYYSDLSEVGLDFTPLISKLVPFNLTETETGLIGLKYKRYKRTHAFRLNVGANLASPSNDENNFFYFSMGYEKRQTFTKNWSYVTGIEFVSYFEDRAMFQEETFIGASKFFGIEFNISEHIFLATEGNLAFLSADGDGIIQFNVPQSIFFFVRF